MREQQAAIGIRAHSGWGAVVVVSESSGRIEVIERRRIPIVDPKMKGASQPFHFAEGMDLARAESYLADCAAVSDRIAIAGVRDLAAGHRAAGCAILLASGRPLPSLKMILASHSLIHAAEGEFFRRRFWSACEELGIKVTGIREKELGERAPDEWKREVAGLGKSIGPPWTVDQKCATLAALLVLRGER